MAKSRVGVVIGRFQVPKLTPAHLKVLESVRTDDNHLVVVLLGVSPNDGRCAENPLTYFQRVSVFNKIDSTIVTLPIWDEPDDAKWSRSVDNLIESTFPSDRYAVRLYGGRASFRETYSGQLPTAVVNTQEAISGTAYRAAVLESPSEDFLSGQTFALQTQYPHVYPTVDAIIWRPAIDPSVPEVEVLLIQRKDTNEWVFCGGFVDPTDETFERAIRREIFEEVGLTAEAGVRYVDSLHVNDWRYRGMRDQIFTSVYTMQYTFGAVRPNPKEVQDFQWVRLSQVPGILAHHHKPLLQAAFDTLKGFVKE